MSVFELKAPFPPRGDQPAAIEQLVQSLEQGNRFTTLLGATGTGKTFTMASAVARLGRPALVIGPNKTLVAQLCSEFREFFPQSAVEYFVSYYDYYQPEAYIANTDTYIEKDSSINDEIDRLRHSATHAVLERRDALVVASVSCIYGLGSPEDYRDTMLVFRPGEELPRDFLLRRLVDMQYSRTNASLTRSSFRLRGEVLEIHPVDEERIYRIEFFGDEVERMSIFDPLTGEMLAEPKRVVIYPARHYVSPRHKREAAVKSIQAELEERLAYFRAQQLLLEAQRLEMRTRYDLEMIEEIGYCNGIENYSRHLTGRRPGEPPYTLLDYFPEDFIVFIDESHVGIPQLRGMLHGDRSRKHALVDHGFRLPSAYDNRPLSFDEFLERVGQVVFVSATPGEFERTESPVIVEQIIRPTGLVDPMVDRRPVDGQIDDLLQEIRRREERNERVLVTTLTKKMAEDLTDYLAGLGVRVRYLHSEVDTLGRIQILRDLRLGEFDVLVGINLLREGLDLPEVSLVAILDADQEGFLRSATSLIQTIGRAARNVSGRVILYADRNTGAIQEAIEETERRREIQIAYNLEHGIKPETVRKAVKDILDTLGDVTLRRSPGERSPMEDLEIPELQKAIERLEGAMIEAARNLEFETAAALRDEMYELRKSLHKKIEGLPIGTAIELEQQGLMAPRASSARRAPLSRPDEGGILTRTRKDTRRRRR
ncbi:MAG: excinuclease ABC subunit UvrB [Armatimonadetes bacterium]|nr:excinuclease ABC subunit UvrB [Armatimonadota bacterium]